MKEKNEQNKKLFESFPGLTQEFEELVEDIEDKRQSTEQKLMKTQEMQQSIINEKSKNVELEKS